MGQPTAVPCKQSGISRQCDYRRRKKYGGLGIAEAKRLKEVERKNAMFKRVVAEPTLGKQVLKDIASGKYQAPRAEGGKSIMRGRRTT